MRTNSDIAGWLIGIDLPQYEAVFRDNAIDLEILPELGEPDLEKLGVLLGHRKKMLRAIAALASEEAAARSVTHAAVAAIEGAERRQLTVMFCDLVASTMLATQLDPEDLHEVLNAYTARVSQVVGRFGGFVARVVGDGVIVYFGYPQAREDDAERALRAALALIDDIEQLEVSTGRLQIRIGIATGLVVVGEIGEAGNVQSHDVVGETPNLAARLQTLAEPNAVIVAPGTRQLVGNLFEFRDCGLAPLKGFAEPVHIWQLLRASTVGSRFEALRSALLTPLVGREDELELLQRRWRRASAGAGQIVLLSGEPGIGKSRILAAFDDSLQGEPHIKVRAFCSPHYQDSPLYPVIAHMERAARFARADTAEARIDKLEALVSQTGEIGTDELALFAELMGLPAGGRYPEPRLDPQEKRERTLAAFARQLEAQAARRPVLLVFEDIHWIDSTTLELLDLLVARVPSLRVLMCLTFRPEFQPPWSGQAHVTALTLSRLEQREAARLVSRIAGDKPMPADIVERIVARADGIPLFAEELTKTLLESGVLQERDGGYELESPLPRLAIPPTLHASLLERLDRHPAIKEVAQVGAVIGREFSSELLAAVARMPDEQMRDGLERLVASGLVFRRGRPPHESFLFKHALVQDAAYASLLRRPRQDMHARIGKVLEQRFSDITALQPEVLAHHYTEAGLTELAIDFWRQAGKRALRSAHVEGVMHLTHAIDLIRLLPHSPERSRRELDLHLALGQVMRATKGYAAPDTLRVFSRARDLLDDGATVNERKTILYALWSVHYVRAEHAEAREVAQQCAALAAQHRDGEVSVLAAMLKGCSSLAMGEFTESRHYLSQTQELSIRDREGSAEARFTQNNGIAALSYLAWALWPLGYPDQAAAAARQAVRRARERGHVPLTAFCLYVDSFLGNAFGATDEASATQADEAVAYCAKHRVTAYEHWARFCQGIALQRRGDGREAIAVMRQSMTAAEKLNAEFLRPLHLGHLAAAEASVGQVGTAFDLLDQALQIAAQRQELFFAAELHRLRGETLLMSGQAQEGEAELERALQMARRQQARLWELRAATSLAQFRRQQGPGAASGELLAPIYGWFTEGLDTADLKNAKALLDELT
jgi:class 3 adenylate cyclase/tetratricopeptide (TPR) repeat protein